MALALVPYAAQRDGARAGIREGVRGAPEPSGEPFAPAVPHGFRSSFRDWAAEETDHPREVIEAVLAHVVPNKVEAAYARLDLFERRRRLMDDWMRYLNGQSRTRSRQRVAGPRRSTAAAHPSRMKSGPGAPRGLGGSV